MHLRAEQISDVMSNFTGTPSGRPRKVYTGSAVTDASGIATLYVTQDGTSTGVPFMTTIEGFWSSTYTTAAAGATTRTLEYDIGSNFVRARASRDNAIVVALLGLTLLGVATFPPGVTINFLVWGD